MAAPRLVLASASPRRHELLGQLGVVPDRVAAPDIDEQPRLRERPRDYALRVAVEKAHAVERADGEAVIAGDTTIALGPRILPPAETESVQAELLRLLSGRRHHVLCAVCVIDLGGHARTRLVDTLVQFKPLTPAEIAAYIACGEGLGKAGGYAIQGRAAGFVKRIDGSYSGVVGLPLYETRALLRASGLALG